MVFTIVPNDFKVSQERFAAHELEHPLRKQTSILVVVALLGEAGLGCAPTTPSKPTGTPSGPPPISSKVAAQAAAAKDEFEKAMVREARPEVESTLDDLLAGKYNTDPNYGPVAQKLGEYESWSIETQTVDPDLFEGVDFSGTLKGKSGEATFTVGMVKRQNGKWMIGHFTGPDPK